MDLEIPNDKWRRVALESSFSGGLPKETANRLRRALQIILAAEDEASLERFKCLRYKKMRGRGKRRSISIGKGFEMIVGIKKKSQSVLTATVERIDAKERKR